MKQQQEERISNKIISFLKKILLLIADFFLRRFKGRRKPLSAPEAALESASAPEAQEYSIVELPIDDGSLEDESEEALFEGLGAIGDGSGVGFIPNSVVIPFTTFNICGFPWQTSTTTNPPTPAATSALSSTYDFIAYSFRAHHTYTVNRVAYRTQAASSPVNYVITGGISTYDTSTGYPALDASNAIIYSGSGTNNTHTASTYSIITIPDTQLSAGSYYSVAFQVSSRDSGSITITGTINAIWQAALSFPCHQRRYATVNGKINVGSSALLWGYNDGSTTTWYNVPFDSNDATTLQLGRTTSPVYNEVGAKISVRLPVQEFFIRGISTYSRIALNQTMTCTIYGADATTQIGSSATIPSWNASTTARWRNFIFQNPIRMMPYSTYYVMFSTAGVTTNTNSSFLYGWLLEVAGSIYNPGMTNVAVTRATAGGAVSEQTNIVPAVNLLVDYTYLGNRVGGNASM